MANWFRKYKFILIVFFLIVQSACGVVKEGSQPVRISPEKPGPILVSSSDDERRSVHDLLYSAHDEWKGTPYVLGGGSKNGIDCSAFTRIIFRDYFEIEIPRHTRDQLQKGSGIRRNHIRDGDLIFFRTSRGVLHVGIAMDNGNFLHASFSSGVMISNISENYWATRFIGARRLF